MSPLESLNWLKWGCWCRVLFLRNIRKELRHGLHTCFDCIRQYTYWVGLLICATPAHRHQLYQIGTPEKLWLVRRGTAAIRGAEISRCDSYQVRMEATRSQVYRVNSSFLEKGEVAEVLERHCCLLEDASYHYRRVVFEFIFLVLMAYCSKLK